MVKGGDMLEALRVIYVTRAGRIDEALDKEIAALAKKYGVAFWAGGYTLETRERDQCYASLKGEE